MPAGSAVERRGRVAHWTDAAVESLRESRLGDAVVTRAERLGMPRLLLVAIMGLWFATFAVLIYRRHDRFGTFDFDLGIYDQSIWLLSEAKSFVTVRGLSLFGHHVTPAFVLFLPFYRLGAGPHLLNLAMVAALVLGAIPVFAASNHYLRNEWQSLVLSVAFLLHFSGQWMLQETFHPEVMAITPFLLAYVASLRERWVPYALWLTFAVAWKEDIALAAAVLGIILAVRGHRRVGLATVVASLGWFLIATRIILPAFSPEGVFYEGFFGELGDSPTEIARTAATNPTEITAQLDRSNALGYVRDLLAPYGFTPLLSPAALLIGAPQALANLLSIQSFTWSLRYHYAAVPLIAATIAMVEGVSRWRRPGLRRFLVGLVAASALATSAAWGISPVSAHYKEGFWPLGDNTRQAAMEAAVVSPAGDDAVSATYNFVPHLTHRRNIYTFPNPWQASNWGVRGENQHDPETVDWLIIDRTTLGADLEVLLDQILATGDWEVLSTTDDILVARRT